MVNVIWPIARQRGSDREISRIIGYREPEVVNGQTGHTWLTAVDQVPIGDGGIGHATQGVGTKHRSSVILGHIKNLVDRRMAQQWWRHHQQEHSRHKFEYQIIFFHGNIILLGEYHLFAVNQGAVGHKGIQVHAGFQVTGSEGDLTLTTSLGGDALELGSLHVIDIDACI